MVEALSDKDMTVRTAVVSENDEDVIFSTPYPALPALPSIEGKPLRFVSGEAAARTVLGQPNARARRRPRMDLFDMAVFVLIVTCAAVCVYRLFWAMQP